MCNVMYITGVIGASGRIVLEVEPDLKRRLYSALALEHRSLKDWFVSRAVEYVRSQHQPDLFITMPANGGDDRET